MSQQWVIYWSTIQSLWAIKVDAFQSEDNGETISSTLLHIKVLIEDLQLGFEIHKQFKTNTPKDVDFNGTKFFYWIGLLPHKMGTGLVTNSWRKMGLIQSKNKHLNCLRPFAYLVTRNSTKNYFASWSSCIKECMEKNHWSQCKFWKCSNNWIRSWWLSI